MSEATSNALLTVVHPLLRGSESAAFLKAPPFRRRRE